MNEILRAGWVACPACGFPVFPCRGREYCSGACRVRMLRVKRGEMTKARAEVLARKARERAARKKAGLSS